MSDPTTHHPMPPAVEVAPPTPAERRGGCGGNRLRHGTIGGDPNSPSVPRCGAKTRAGTPCQGPAIRGRARCRLHGGLSTGARTAAGLAAIVAANTRHGGRGGPMKTLMRQLRAMRLEAEAMVARLAAAQRDAKPRAAALTPDNDNCEDQKK